MPVGPFATLDACLSGMEKAYPDEATRRKVCGSLEQATKARGDERRGRAAHDHATLNGEVFEGPGFWLIRGNNVGTRPGVNANGHLKRWPAIRASAESFNGRPIIYGHPSYGPILRPGDEKFAAGLMVNVRADDATQTLLYDTLLFKEPPPGFETRAEDLKRNARVVELRRAGVPVGNSPGFVAGERVGFGFADAQGGNGRRFYTLEQVWMRGDHMALLDPILPKVGACNLREQCGMGVPMADEKKTTTGGDPPAFDQLSEREFADWVQGLVDTKVRACADEKLKELQEKNRMDEKDLAALRKAAADEAGKVLDEKLKPFADALEGLKALPKLSETVTALKGRMDERDTKEKARADESHKGLAQQAALLKVGVMPRGDTAEDLHAAIGGLDKDTTAKFQGHFDRLKGFSDDALQEIIAAQTERGVTDPSVFRGPAPGEKPDPNEPYGLNGDGHMTVKNWGKVPRFNPTPTVAPKTPPQGAS